MKGFTLGILINNAIENDSREYYVAEKTYSGKIRRISQNVKLRSEAEMIVKANSRRGGVYVIITA